MALPSHPRNRRRLVVPLAIAAIAAAAGVGFTMLDRQAQGAPRERATPRAGTAHPQPPGLATLVANQKADANGKIYVRENPREIVRSMRNTLPLSRAEVFRSTYADRWVRWRGTVLSVGEPRPGAPATGSAASVRIRDGATGDDVLLDLAPEKRGTFDQLREGDVIDYEAQIEPELAHPGGAVALHNVAGVNVVDAPARP